jgi:hypothetical protein
MSAYCLERRLYRLTWPSSHGTIASAARSPVITSTSSSLCEISSMYWHGIEMNRYADDADIVSSHLGSGSMVTRFPQALESRQTRLLHFD